MLKYTKRQIINQINKHLIELDTPGGFKAVYKKDLLNLFKERQPKSKTK